MSGELYSALSGASSTWTQIETLSNNIANSSTTGFRAVKTRFELTGPQGGTAGQAYAMARNGGVSSRDGAIIHDHQPTHLALQGDGWFAVQAPDGQLLTRDGRFGMDDEGRLVTAAGYPVLGEGGPIELPEGETLQVSAEGIISGSESGEIGKLKLVSAGEVEPVGGNLYRPQGKTMEARPMVEQGALEGSNADPMTSMVELMEASRYFEAFQKAMQSSDELDARLIELGRP